MDKFESQNRHYIFPYHHIPHQTRDGTCFRSRALGWGLEYLCYSLELKALVESIRPDSILDVGCGDGRFLNLLDDSIAKKVGVDLSERAIGFAKAFGPHIDFRVADVAELSESFEVVTLIEVLEHIPDEIMVGFLTAVYERLKAGGSLIISVPTTVFPTLGKHYRHYDEELLRDTLEAAGVTTSEARIRYLIPQSKPFWVWLLEKAAFNRLWSFEFRPLQKLLWRWQWSSRETDRSQGRHLVLHLTKMG